jgi:hypothetical protein
MTDISGTGDADLGDGVGPLFLDPMEELGEFADRYAEAKAEPERLLAELLEDSGFRTAMARADVRPHLLRWFQEIEPGWREDPRRSGRLGVDPESGSESLQSVGTSWTFSGVHAEVGSIGGELASGTQVPVEGFNGLHATGRKITVTGFTVMAVDLDEEKQTKRLSVHRHVDWAGLYGQLGLTLNWRLPAEDPDPDT